jgi:septum formation protein
LPLEHPTLVKLHGQRVILASASPRRRHLLAQVGLANVEIIPSMSAENLPKSLSPFEYVLATATEKAMTVYRAEIDNAAKGEPALVLAADTVVVSHGGDILEKPRSEREHIAMLKMLRSDEHHRVVTAVAVMVPLEEAISPGYRLESCVEETLVKFDNGISDAELLAYVKTREGADKAGGYGIQGIGGMLVERIEGSFDNVVGLPVRATIKLIEKVLEPPEGDDEDVEDLLGDLT